MHAAQLLRASPRLLALAAPPRRLLSCQCRAFTSSTLSSSSSLGSAAVVSGYGGVGCYDPLRRHRTLASFDDKGSRGGAVSVGRRCAHLGRPPTYQEVSEALTVLGVSIDEDPKKLKRVYRDLVKKNHPDAGGDAKKMALITVCYDRLEGMSKRDKEEFKMQQKMYTGRGGAGVGGFYRGPPRNQYAPPGPSGGYGGEDAYTHHRKGFAEYYSHGSDPFAQARAHQKAYYNQYHKTGGEGEGGGFGDNPFGGRNPFSMFSAAQRSRFLNPASLVVQGMAVYLVLTIIFLFIYRAVRDYRNVDGWKMSEEYARHEQMQELHRIRQELNSQREELLRTHGGDPEAYASALHSRLSEQQRQAAQASGPMAASLLYRNAVSAGSEQEQRALEYARKRRIQLMEQEQRQAQVSQSYQTLFAGWPAVSEEDGRLIKRAQDPIGVVFFEPRKGGDLQRQVKNRMKGIMKVEDEDAKAKAMAAEKKEKEGKAAAAAAAAAPGLPPEQNVGAVVAASVSNSADAAAAMRSIMEAFRSAQGKQ